MKHMVTGLEAALEEDPRLSHPLGQWALTASGSRQDCPIGVFSLGVSHSRELPFKEPQWKS